MELDLWQWLTVSVCTLIYGFSKTGFAGAPVVCTPLMLLIFTPEQTLGIILPMLIFADCVTLLWLRRKAKWRYVAVALPWAILGIVLGWLIARYASGLGAHDGQVLFRRVIAASMLVVVLLGFVLRFKPGLIFKPAAEPPEGAAAGGAEGGVRRWTAVFFGIFGGATTMLANNGGPVWSVYLLALRLRIDQFLGTAAWLFAILNLTKLPFGISLGFVNWDTLGLNLYLIPFAALGVVCGRFVTTRVSQKTFDHVTQALALIGSLYLLFS